jgi:hypothetical protein
MNKAKRVLLERGDVIRLGDYYVTYTAGTFKWLKVQKNSLTLGLKYMPTMMWPMYRTDTK